jgi:hypothetical protein
VSVSCASGTAAAGSAARNWACASSAKRPGTRHQFVESAALDDAAVVELEDVRRVADGRKAVGDHEGGAAPHHLIERDLHLALRGGVERTRRLVEDQADPLQGGGMREAIGYIRVSTVRQGRSGLGLEAQRAVDLPVCRGGGVQVGRDLYRDRERR